MIAHQFVPYLLGIGFLLTAIWFYYYYGRDGFNPMTLFILAWPLSYTAYLFYPYPADIQIRLSGITHWVIWATIAAFVVGWRIADRDFNPNLRIADLDISNKTFESAIVAMMLLGILAYVIQFQAAGGLDVFLNDQGAFERQFGISLVDDVFNLGLLAGVLGLVYILRRRLNIIAIVAVFVGLMLATLSLHRQLLLMYLILVTVVWNYLGSRFTIKQLAGVGLIFIGSMVIVVKVISWGLTGGIIGRSGVIYNPVVTQIYWYYAMGIRNVELTIAQLSPYGAGFPYLTFKPIWAVLFLKDTVGYNELFVTSDLAKKEFYAGWTTPTFIRPFYFDFGIAGLIVGTALIGYLSTRLYISLRRNPSTFKILVYGLVVNAIVLLFFSNRFTNPRTLVTIFQIILLLLVANKSDVFISRLRRDMDITLLAN